MYHKLIAAFLLLATGALFLTNTNVSTGYTSTCNPTQVRLQLGDSYLYANDQWDNSDVAITFHTKSQCADSKILITQGSYKQEFTSHEITHSKYDNQEFCHGDICEQVYYNQYIHHFKIRLQNLGQFQYSINGGNFLSDGKTFQAKVPQKSSSSQQKFIYFGDLDNSAISQNTWKLLDSLKKDQSIDAYIFLGDYGYEFFQNDGAQGDLFLETLEPYATSVPWLLTPGNHEDNLNYSFYNDKIHHPNYRTSNNHYYSVDIGLVHFISVDLNFYNNGDDIQTMETKQRMRDWLERDLKQAVKHRNQVPWIIASGHVPLYCVASDCNDYATTYHHFDDLFYQYGVDLFIGAHKHKYQFLKPLYQDQILGYSQPDEHTIKNPKGPVHVVQGNGGNRNMQSGYGKKHSEYLLFEDSEPGVGRLTVVDKNQLLLEFIRSDTQKVADYQRIIKDEHNQPQ